MPEDEALYEIPDPLPSDGPPPPPPYEESKKAQRRIFEAVTKMMRKIAEAE